MKNWRSLEYEMYEPNANEIGSATLREWITTDCRNTPSTTNPEDEVIVDAPGNDGDASMPEQVIGSTTLREWTTPDSRNTPSTTNPEDEVIVDAPGNDDNASMPEPVKRPNPWRKMMIMVMS